MLQELKPGFYSKINLCYRRRMAAMLLLLFGLAVSFLFLNYFKDRSKNSNELTRLILLLNPVGARLQPTDSVLFISHNETDEFWYKVQFALSPVTVLRPMPEEAYPGKYLLCIMDRKAADMPPACATAKQAGIEITTSENPDLSVHLYRLP